MVKIILSKKLETGATQQWEARVEGNKVLILHGQVGGAIQERPYEFTEGKNIGRSNEIGPIQVCENDVARRARKQFEKGYSFEQGEEWVTKRTGKTVIASDVTVPKPMLAQVYDKHIKKVQNNSFIYVQPKLDGNRAIINIKTKKMYSRSRKEIKHLPHIIEATVEACKNLEGVEWVDGELYSKEISFNQIQTIIRKYKETDNEEIKKMHYYIFDVIEDASWDQRRLRLHSILDHDIIFTLEDYKIHPSKIDEYHKMFVENGYEGLMIRIATMKYEQKRSMGLFKYKHFQDDECVIVGFKAERIDPNKLGSVKVIDDEGRKFDARPAMPDTMKAKMWSNTIEYYGKIATIKFQERDEKSGIPRFPVLTRLRTPSDADEKKIAKLMEHLL